MFIGLRNDEVDTLGKGSSVYLLLLQLILKDLYDAVLNCLPSFIFDPLLIYIGYTMLYKELL